ncbi:hypothetical protein DPX16_21218 [Anabarilius grahami]|uniref:Uncharacterized protein n=1 Tax=Anabarilius grahami TaxID=495550 RepID=A0A3N0XH52_ANAGA|nr:hypothetical protein DPX16_21218 [Anabarilius grahami]
MESCCQQRVGCARRGVLTAQKGYVVKQNVVNQVRRRAWYGEGVIEGGEGAHSARQRLDTVQKSWRMAPGASAENRHNHDATTSSLMTTSEVVEYGSGLGTVIPESARTVIRKDARLVH